MYDTIIIGNDVSSLIAALILSRHGMKTVLLSDNDHSNIFSDSQYTFNCDPFPLTGFGLNQTCSRVFADLQIPLTDISDIQKVNPGLQIILPDHRMDCFFEQDAFLQDLEREFPVYRNEISQFYSSVVKIGYLLDKRIYENPTIYPRTYNDFLKILKTIPILIRERLSILKYFRFLKKNPALCRFSEAIMSVLSYIHEATGKFSLLSAYILSLPMKGIYYNNSSNDLFSTIRTKYEKFGGQIIENCSVIRTCVNKEIDVDIKALDTLSTIRGRYLIASTKSKSMKLLIENNRKLAHLNRKLRSAKTTFYPFTIHMGVLEKCIPEKMGHYVVIIGDEEKPVMDNNLVFLKISSKDDTARASCGKRALSATAFLQESPSTLNDNELKGVSTAIFKSVEACLPFLNENLDYFNIEKSIEMSRRCQEMINQKYMMPFNPFFGISRISHKTPIRNVILTGGMLLAGFGFEGEIISGMNAANAVLEQKEKYYE